MLNWIDVCNKWKNKWSNIDICDINDSNGIDLYYIIDCINNLSNENDIFLTDAGTPYYVLGQRLKIKDNQKIIFPAAQADMGFCLPASVGVYLSNNKHNPILIIGDGSFNTNLQELAVIKSQNVPAKILLLNNDGYLSIRNTQKNFYNNNIYGESSSTGLFFPNYKLISESYNIGYYLIENNIDLYETLEKTIHTNVPIIYEIKCKFYQDIIPTLNLKTDNFGNKIQTGLHDMYPFLSEKEIESEKIVNLD